jgi:predicted nucleic acid-binding protein
VKGLADTGFLVAFANRNDIHHDWTVGVAEQVTEPLLA